jgi:phosphoribosylaminoimidazole-succinocarboxamide synthase
MSQKSRTKIYEGKAKILFKGPQPNTIIQYYKDDATAFNNQKRSTIEGKGSLNNSISSFLMTKIKNFGIPTHFIKKLNIREQLVYSVKIIPIEVVVRNIAAGSICKRLNLKEGEPLPRSIIEYYYKSDELGDPLILEDHILASLKINEYLVELFSKIGIKLVDFKLEFGKSLSSKDNEILLADELSPDNFRLWDKATNKKLDKDRFRLDLGNTIDAYKEVAQRLGILDSVNI